jgi:hypothetical protein
VDDPSLVTPAGRVVVGDYLHWDDLLCRVVSVEHAHHRLFDRPSVNLVVVNPHGGPDRSLHYWADDDLTVTRVTQ